jgi:hypothetical protein
MNNNPKQVPWLSARFFENRDKFPPEELQKFAGQYVAFSWDGSRILASAPGEEELWGRLESTGVDPNQVVFSFVEDL